MKKTKNNNFYEIFWRFFFSFFINFKLILAIFELVMAWIFFLLNLPIISVFLTEFSGFRWFFREFSIYGVFSNFCLFVFCFVFSQNPVEIGKNGYFLQN